MMACRSPTCATHPAGPSLQTGSGTLALLLVMLLGCTLMLLHLNRALLVEQRAAALQWRSTLAFEAAEAGRAWAVAQLNHDQGIDDNCRPYTAATSASAAPSLRERLLTRDGSTGQWRPTALQPACALGTDGSLGCSCAASTGATTITRPALPGGSTAASSYVLSLRPGPRTGTFLLESRGCVGAGNSGAGNCDDPARADAQAVVRTGLGTLSLAPVSPGATLVARGPVSLSGAVTLVHAQAESGGLAVDSGGTLTLDGTARLLGPPGSGAAGAPAGVSTGAATTASTGLALSSNPRWATLTADGFFASHFGLRRARVASLPGLTRLDCTRPCGAASVDAALAGGARTLWLDGSLDASASTVRWGSAGRPLLLVVSGRSSLSGASQLHGLLYTGELVWTNVDAAPGSLSGAVVSEGAVSLNGALMLSHDGETLARTAQAAAVLAPVPGSWRDFTD
jgi:Tfp pilus assembly protein PilX